MKFGFIWTVVSTKKLFESVDGRPTSDDGQTTEAAYPISSPRSLRLREAKNLEACQYTLKCTHLPLNIISFHQIAKLLIFF